MGVGWGGNFRGQKIKSPGNVMNCPENPKNSKPGGGVGWGGSFKGSKNQKSSPPLPSPHLPSPPLPSPLLTSPPLPSPPLPSPPLPSCHCSWHPESHGDRAPAWARKRLVKVVNGTHGFRNENGYEKGQYFAPKFVGAKGKLRYLDDDGKQHSS